MKINPYQDTLSWIFWWLETNRRFFKLIKGKGGHISNQDGLRHLNNKYRNPEGSRTMSLKFGRWGFSSGSVVNNLSASAGDISWIPDLGRSHMSWSDWVGPQLLSLCSRTRAWELRLLNPLGAATPEPANRSYWSPHTLEPKLCGKRNRGGEKPTHHN